MSSPLSKVGPESAVSLAADEVPDDLRRAAARHARLARHHAALADPHLALGQSDVGREVVRPKRIQRRLCKGLTTNLTITPELMFQLWKPSQKY